MADEQVEVEVVEAKPVGSNVVMFNLTDQTRIRVTITISNVLRSKEPTPDGIPKYYANANMSLEFLQPAGKTIKVPRSIFGPSQAPAKPTDDRLVT